MGKYWFKRKRYGWGWVPVTWQGWLLIGAYLTIPVGGALMMVDSPPESMNREFMFFIIFVFVATFGLLLTTYRHGPNPKWRWGKSEDDNPDEDL